MILLAMVVVVVAATEKFHATSTASSGHESVVRGFEVALLAIEVK